MARAASCVFCCWVLLGFPGEARGEPYLSPLAVTVHGDTVWVAAATADRVLAFNVQRREVVHVVAVTGSPSGLMLSPGGERLYVTCGGAEGRVQIIDTAKSEVISELNTGHTPSAPLISPDGQTLFVCNRFNDEVSVIDLAGPRERVRIPVSREPVAAALSLDGHWLFVANLLPAGRADGGYVAAVVDVIDAQALQPAGTITLPNGSTSLHGICMSPDGQYAYVTHILARYHLPTTQLERGWINTNALSVIDVAAKTLVNTVLLDELNLGAANPWGVACTPDGKWLCVAHAGSHELSVIDRARLHEKLAAAATAGIDGETPNDLAFLLDMRQRVPLKGKGPRGLAALGSRIYVAEYYSGTLGLIDLADGPQKPALSLALGQEPPLTTVRRGEMLFHDASVCFQHWQSCASCHPGNARVDGLNWDLLNDGMGNPKNVKNLLLAHATPPSMVTGIRDSAETAVRAGIRYILFSQLPEEQAVAIDEYLKSLTPVASPRLEAGKLSTTAERGQAVFESAKCGTCHPAPLFTDLKQHRVGTGAGSEEAQRFDTPTLIETWRTAPYLHDGRAAAMNDVLTTFNAGDKHGRTSQLTKQEIEDLVEYVLSL
ncbi:MAG: c-type cytochrome [Candidatus Hydrogenedentes bacterium]|nr:c-type cytochrome [Candidatus Hydrogenedentota bacterium]